MGNCGSNPPAVEDAPGARERSYSASGTQVLFDRIDTLKQTVADLEGELAEQRKKSNGLEVELANLTEENETYKKEQEEVHSVVSGFEETVDKVVAEKDSVITKLQVGRTPGFFFFFQFVSVCFFSFCFLSVFLPPRVLLSRNMMLCARLLD